jgi:6-phosphogluconolactonase (cycloisomerase 2 family)
MRSIIRIIHALLWAMCLVLAACGGGGGTVTPPPPPPPPPQVTLTSLSVSAEPRQMLGQHSALSATAHYSDGSTKDVTASATWKSSNPLVLSVSTGSLTGSAARLSNPKVRPMDGSPGSPQAVATQLGVAYVSASVSGKTASSEVAVLGYPRFAYIANELNDSVSAYVIDSDTGELRFNGYGFTVTTAFTSCFTVHQSAKFGYAVNFWPQGGQNGALPSISTFWIQDDGTLVKGVPLTVPGRPGCLKLSPTGKFAYLYSLDDHTITAYSVNADTAQLTEIVGSPWTVPDEPWGMDIDPTGRFLYLTTVNKIFGFALNADSGVLSSIAESPFTGWPDGNMIAVEPSGRFAYVTDPSSDVITVYKIDDSTGALKEVDGARTSTGGLNPQRPVFDRTGQYLYVPNMEATWGVANGNIGAFRINSTNGLLTKLSGSPFVAGEVPKDAAVDIDGLGKYLYVTDGYNFVRAYQIDQATGALTFLDKFATRRGVNSVAVVSGATPVQQKSNHAWALNKADGTITTLGLDAQGGLVPVSSASTAPGGTQLVVEHAGDWVDVVNPVTNRLYTFQGDASGALTTYASFDMFGPVAAAVDQSGLAFYVANSTGNSISIFVHPILGLLTGGATVNTGPAPSVIALDPNDQYVYVANSGDDTVSYYALSPEYGFPTEVKWGSTPSPLSLGPDVKAIAFEPRGKFAYVISANSILGFSVDYYDDGPLAPIANFPQIILNTPKAIVADVHGRRLYAADGAGVHTFPIDTATGKLGQASQDVPAGSSPTAMAIDASGTWLFVTDAAIGIQPFAIDPLNGTLTAYPVIPSGQAVSIALDVAVQ